MWEQVFVMTVEVPAEQLWRAATEVPTWPMWDGEVEMVRPQSLPRVGECFWVKGRNGRQARSTVEECLAPRQFAYTTRLFLGLLRTRFEFEPTAGGTRVWVTLQVSGLLGPFWRRVLRETQVGHLAERATRLVRQAREHARQGTVPNREGQSARPIVLSSLRGVP